MARPRVVTSPGNQTSVSDAYRTQLMDIQYEFEDKCGKASRIARRAIAKNLLKNTPVDTGFLRNHAKASNKPLTMEYTASDRNDSSIAALQFQNLTYGLEPSDAELAKVLGTFDNEKVEDCYIGLPVSYAERLKHLPKYTEYDRKAALVSQVDLDTKVSSL